MGAPVGPTGCEGGAQRDGSWFVGGGAAATQTTLSFTGERELDITQYAITASGGYATASQWSFRGSVGAVLGGQLEGEGRTHDIGPGLVLTAGVAKHLDFGEWFVAGSLGAGISRTTTDAETAGADRRTLVGLDLFRIGVLGGRRFGIVSPYVMARGFAGPVSWTLDAMDVTGSDTSKFQLGAGASLTTASGLSVLVDISALGERSASLGVSYRL